MPRKEFEAFTRLDASDVNTFLMDQSVMSFAGTAARGSAIPTPVEGMVAYLEDSNSLQLYDGTKWGSTTGVSLGNAIINGAFEINQRGFTSTTTTGAYGHDRWALGAVGGTSTYSTQAFTLGAAPIAGYEGTNHARLVSTGQSASNSLTALRQSVESVRSFAGQTVTVSFFAKSGSGTPNIVVWLQQEFGTGGSTQVNTGTTKQAISTSWTRYSFTATLPSISGKTIGGSNDDKLTIRLVTSAGAD
jgi:hypothetical protein